MDDFDDAGLMEPEAGEYGLPPPLAAWPPRPAGRAARPLNSAAGTAQQLQQRQRLPQRRAAPDVADILAGLGDGCMSGSDEEPAGSEPSGCSGRGDDSSQADGEGDGDDEGSAARSCDGGSDAGGGGTGSEGGEEEAEVDDVDPDELIEADYGLDRSAVLARIEGFVGDAVACIARGQLPELEMVSRAAGNTHIVADGGGGADDMDADGDGGGGGGEPWPGSEGLGGGAAESDVLRLGSQGGGDDGGGGGAAGGARAGRRRRRLPGQAAARRLRLGSLTQTKSMTFGQGRQAHSVARVFCVLNVVHELLSSGRQATQRDLYYKLLGPPLFPNAAAVSAAICDAASLLRVPRGSLGIACSPRGAVAGRVALRDGPAGAWVDCAALGMAGHAIPGELAAVERLSFRVSARYILVVEKDCIFQRLAEDRLHERLPLVMVTAKGQPDIATRAFLSRLCAAAPSLPVLGLVDWNPSGVCILCTYKFGNPRAGLEGTRYALPRLRWLGVLSPMLADVPRSAFHALSGRDGALIAGLRRRLAGNAAWLGELAEMEEQGLKCDIEALYTVGGFEGLHRQLARRILQQDYI